MPAKKEKNQKTSEIVIYRSQDKSIAVEAQLKKETIWLTQAQIAEIFGTKRPAITKHLKNIFSSGELEERVVSSILEHTTKHGAIEGKNQKQNVKFYNLDVIISVGYRVNSQRATQFRIWATKVLRDHIIKGYTINKQRLPQLQNKTLIELEQTLGLIKKTISSHRLSNSETTGLLQVITDYANTWVLLQKYDEAKLALPTKGKKISKSLDYNFAKQAIGELKDKLIIKKQATDIFGRERERGLEQIMAGLEQSFGGKRLYNSVEQRAAHLLYFVIKDHPFVDGNKRIASFLFILFLARNKFLLNKKGEKKISDHGLVALALLIAESDAKQKEVMVKLIMNFLG